MVTRTKNRRYVQKCTQQQKWQKKEHVGEFGKYDKNVQFCHIRQQGKEKSQEKDLFAEIKSLIFTSDEFAISLL